MSHMVTPHQQNMKQYSTRTNPQGVLFQVPKLELFYQIRKVVKKNNQGLQASCDLRKRFEHYLRTQDIMEALGLTNSFKPFNFTNIIGQPHDMLASL